MRLVFKAAVVFAIAAMAFLGSPISAGTIIFQDNFEGGAIGTALPDTTPTGGAGAYYAAPAGVTPATIESDNGSGKCAYYGDTITDGVQMCISPANSTAITGQVVQFNFDYYGASVRAATGSELTALTGYYAGRAFDLYLYGDGTIQYYNPDVTAGGGMVTAGSAGSFRPDAWVPVQVTADFGTHTFHATVDGFGFDGAWAAAGPSTFDNFYATINQGLTGVGIDNLTIQSPPPVPEPSTLLLTSVGLFGLLAYAWRKQ